ncbi:MAG: hypothetical protein NVS9B4_26800 [Candidatus Acidiferrum sp.]
MLVVFLFTVGAVLQAAAKDDAIESARHAYELGDYRTAVNLLQSAAAKEPNSAPVDLLLAKNYYELQQWDLAIASAEKAVALDPKNSVYHEWLGRCYGEKAARSGWVSAVSLAKKTHKEFETAVELDARNFAARQALVEFDCSAPGMVGGGEEKARPHIEQLASMDASEGHYAAGNCRRQKKDYAAADAEFAKALKGNPKSLELIFDIGDYAARRNQAERLWAVADAAEKISAADPRAKFYRAAALVVKKEQPELAEKLLQQYLKTAPRRNNYPPPASAHDWLGRLYEDGSKLDAATNEYRKALKLDPKDKLAQEHLEHLQKN